MNFEKIRESITDSVTFEFIVNPYTLSCGHTFSKSTIDILLNEHNAKVKKYATCPKCRTEFTSLQIKKNFEMKEIIDNYRFMLNILEKQSKNENKLDDQSEISISSDNNEDGVHPEKITGSDDGISPNKNLLEDNLSDKSILTDIENIMQRKYDFNEIILNLNDRYEHAKNIFAFVTDLEKINKKFRIKCMDILMKIYNQEQDLEEIN